MSGAIQLTEVDFDQIKVNLVDYLKSTKQFTDYDFSGSNLQVILNLISYQAQLNAYSTNMIANESFLASATLRDNVVSNAKSIGYVPTSARSSRSTVTFSFQFTETQFPSGYPSFVELQPGMVFTTGNGSRNFVFNTVSPQSAPVTGGGLCRFNNVTVYEGTYLDGEFVVNKSNFDQKFVLENDNIDTSTILVEVQENPNEETNTFYEQATNLVTIGADSPVYWLNEVDKGYYELTFGDGYFGKALKDGAKIFVTYVAASGEVANGVNALNNFSYTGRILTSLGKKVTAATSVLAASTTEGGAEPETVSSIKFRAPKFYGTQNRAVTSMDYETLVKQIYPATDDVYVYGGEELAIPEYGRIFIAIKPSTGENISAITKNYIKESLKEYRVASLDVTITDASILYIEVLSTVFYNDKLTIKDSAGIVSAVDSVLGSYSVSNIVSKFGGAVRYSRIVGTIDDADTSITRNTTTLRMRKNMTAIINGRASYEVCFEQKLATNTGSSVVYSTGFTQAINNIDTGNIYYFEDDGLGNIYSFYFDSNNQKIISNTIYGTVDYLKGEIMIGQQSPVVITSTVEANNVIKVKANPSDQDVVAKESVYLDLDLANSSIVAVIDTNLLSS